MSRLLVESVIGHLKYLLFGSLDSFSLNAGVQSSVSHYVVLQFDTAFFPSSPHFVGLLCCLEETFCRFFNSSAILPVYSSKFLIDDA